MKYIFSVLCLFVFTGIIAQQAPFERYYNPTDRGQITRDILPMEDGRFAAISIVFDQDSTNAYAVNFGILSDKGDIGATYDVIFGDSLKVLSAGGLIQPDSSSFLFAVDIDTTGKNRVVVSITPNGQINWTRAFSVDSSNPDFTGKKFNQTLLPYSDTTSLLVASPVRDEFSSLLVTNFRNDGVLVNWGRSYDYSDLVSPEYDECWGNLIEAVDTSYTGVGNVKTLNGFVFVTNIDTSGVVQWSRRYTFPTASGQSTNARDLVQFSDSTYMVVGSVMDNSGQSFGYYMTLDTLGNIIDSSFLISNIPGIPQNTDIMSIELASDTSAVVSVKSETAADTLRLYMLEITKSGNITWEKKYNPTSTQMLDNASLEIIEGDGYALYATAQVDGDDMNPYFIKSDPEGATMCTDENTMDLQFSNVMTILTDTLVWSENGEFLSEEINTNVRPFSSYDIPIGTDRLYQFCPNEPIDTLLDASKDDYEALSYEWSTGETTDTLRVTEEGDYMVTITYDTIVCFVICETHKVTRRTIVDVSLDVDLSRYCTDPDNRPFDIIANEIPGTGPYTYEWEGFAIDTDAVLNLNGPFTEPQTYTVTVTDACGDTATSSIEVTFPQPDVVTIDQGPVFCYTPTVALALNSQNGTDEELYTNVVWSNGFTEESVIRVTEPGMYSATLIDTCGFEVMTNTITLTEEDFVAYDPMPEFDISYDSFCEDSLITLTYVNPGASPPFSFQWLPNGEVTPSIQVTQEGVYQIELVDECGEPMIFNTPAVTYPEVDPSITINSVGCINGNISLGLVKDPDELTLTDIEWGNTGGALPQFNNLAEITVPNIMDTYVAMGTMCFEEVSDEITVTPPDTIVPIISATVSCEEGPDFGTVTLTIDNFNELSGVEWLVTTVDSTGTVEETIIGERQITGKFLNATLSYTDPCYGEFSLLIVLPFCDECLLWPNVFAPELRSTEYEENKSFGPLNLCGDALISYNLQVYNRWGQRVFETDEVSETWDGMFKDKPAMGEVYMYYAEYSFTQDGEVKTVEVKGDITLLR